MITALHLLLTLMRISPVCTWLRSLGLVAHQDPESIFAKLFPSQLASQLAGLCRCMGLFHPRGKILYSPGSNFIEEPQNDRLSCSTHFSSL